MNDAHEVALGAHDREIQALREMHDLQQEMINALGESVESLLHALATYPELARRVQRLNDDHDKVRDLVMRHEATLRAMHYGLHNTTDPR